MSKQRRTLISVLILVFFAVCFLQVFPQPREDWPFSYFGMYTDLRIPINVVRLEMDLISANGRQQSVYDLDSFFNQYLVSDLLEILTGSRKMTGNPNPLKTDPQTLHQVQQSIRKRVIPNLPKTSAPEMVLQIRYRFWSRLTRENHKNADFEKIVLRASLAEWTSL